jgi:hypothetical protein
MSSVERLHFVGGARACWLGSPSDHGVISLQAARREQALGAVGRHGAALGHGLGPRELRWVVGVSHLHAAGSQRHPRPSARIISHRLTQRIITQRLSTQRIITQRLSTQRPFLPAPVSAPHPATPPAPRLPDSHRRCTVAGPTEGDGAGPRSSAAAPF